jgi:hypothetical protein
MCDLAKHIELKSLALEIFQTDDFGEIMKELNLE